MGSSVHIIACLRISKGKWHPVNRILPESVPLVIVLCDQVGVDHRPDRNLKIRNSQSWRSVLCLPKMATGSWNWEQPGESRHGVGSASSTDADRAANIVWMTTWSMIATNTRATLTEAPDRARMENGFAIEDSVDHCFDSQRLGLATVGWPDEDLGGPGLLRSSEKPRRPLPHPSLGLLPCVEYLRAVALRDGGGVISSIP